MNEKSKHYNILHLEGKKNNKKKRVSFSLFQAETFEEIAKLRKIREASLNNFLESKLKTNQPIIENIQNRSKQTSPNRNYGNSILKNTNQRKNDNKENNKLYSIPKPQKKNLENTVEKKIEKNRKIFEKNENKKERNEINDEEKKNLEEEERKKKEEDLQKKIEEEEKKNEKEEEEEEKNEKEEEEEEEKNEKEEKEESDNEETKNLEEEERKKKEEEEEELKKKLEEEEEKRKEEEEKRLKLMEEKLKKELEEKLKMEEEERIKNAILKANITTFYSTLNRIYHSQNRKNYYFYFFLNQIKNILSYQFDYYLDYENNDQEYNNFIQSKIRFFLGKKFLNEYLIPLKKEKEKRIIYNENIKKSNKFIQYRNYKMKAFIYEALFNFAKKQKQWIKNTQSELLKGLIWSCIDNMKLYVNYKKIKRYFIQKKQKRIFDAIKNNKQLSLEMAKKAKKLSLIFEYKLFFKFTRKRILSKKGEDVNKKICEEFRKQCQMKNIFKTLQLYYKMKLNKKTKTKKLFNVKHENKDFINIRVSQKETVKYNDNSTTKKISNRINVV